MNGDKPYLHIIGFQKIISNLTLSIKLNVIVEFYEEVFPKLEQLIKDFGGMSRYVGFHGMLNERDKLCFLGVEVKKTDNIPKGMIGWQLYKDKIVVIDLDHSQEYSLNNSQIKWDWLDLKDFGTVGDFQLTLPSVLKNKYHKNKTQLFMSANAYVDLSVTNKDRDEIYLVDYDPNWPQEFKKISQHLSHLFEGIILKIEHYGSTAIPNMPAKPIIDLLAEVSSFEKARQQMISKLNNKFWDYFYYKDHMIFIKRDSFMGKRTHHLHIAPKGHRLWEGIAFRDYMIDHPNEAKQYAKLKKELSKQFIKDRERYTDEKHDFVKKITKRALKRYKCD